MTTIQIERGKLNEQIRHDLATEAVSQGELGVKKDTLLESSRHNKVTEGISAGELGVHQGTLLESTRSNKAKESISWSQLDETKRHDFESERAAMLSAQGAYIKGQAAMAQAQVSNALSDYEKKVKLAQSYLIDAQEATEKARAEGLSVDNEYKAKNYQMELEKMLAEVNKLWEDRKLVKAKTKTESAIQKEKTVNTATKVVDTLFNNALKLTDRIKPIIPGIGSIKSVASKYSKK